MGEILKKEEAFLNDIRGIINAARAQAVRSGFSIRQLAFCRQFYRVYPIANALRSQLNWTQYRMLIQIDDPDKRMYYELESANNGWTARENLPSVSCFAPTKNDTAVRMALPEDNKTILASEYKLYLPTQSQLIDEVNSVRKMVEEQREFTKRNEKKDER